MCHTEVYGDMGLYERQSSWIHELPRDQGLHWVLIPLCATEILLFDKCAKMWKSLENSELQEKTTGTQIRLYGIFNVYCNAEDGSRLFSCEVETTLRYQTWEVCAISSTARSKPWKLSWTSPLSVTGVPQNMQLHVYTNGLLLIELCPP